MFKNFILTVCAVFITGYTHGQTFTDVFTASGLNFLNITADSWGSGVSFYDFNQDGWDDLSFARENASPIIYTNNQGNFQIAPINFNNNGTTKMFLWVDYDNDGDLDIFVTTRYGKNYLYQNDGNFDFIEVTISAGLFAGTANNYGAAFGDYNKDGFLDLYICRYYEGAGDSTNLVFVNNLYHNNGDGTFTDITFNARVANGKSQSFQPIWFDYNKDTWPDLYVVNDKNYLGTLYRNNQDGTFEDVSVSSNLSMAVSNLMTGSVADYNNDQFLDLFVTNTANDSLEEPALFENQGGSTFLNVYEQHISTMDHTTWGGLWIDVDNDNKQDLYVATDFLNPSISSVSSYFYYNNFPLGFNRDSTMFIGNPMAASHAVARGDFDNSGSYDIAVYNEAPGYSFLWENSGNSNNHIKITLAGTVSNSMAIGSWIHVFVEGEQYTQYTLCGENYLGQNSQHHIFGLGQATIVDSVHIEYLSGIVDKYYNLAVNQSYLFTEGELTPPLNLNIQGDNPFCEGDSVLLSAPNMLSYSWSTGDTTPSIVVYIAGTYALNAMDTNGLLLSSGQVQLNQIDHPIVTIEVHDPSCFNSSDGQAAVQITNEGQAFEILWSTGQVGDSLFGLSAGVYALNYLDELGCKYTDSILIDAPSPLNVQADIQAQTIDSQGSIHILANGGVPPYTILLDNIQIGSSSINMDSGEYVLVIIDSNGCEYEDLLIIPFETGTDLFENINHNGSFEIAIKPNPIEDLIRISTTIPFRGILSWEIIDVSGKKILQNHERFPSSELHRSFQINLESLTRGIYFFRLTYQNEACMMKLIKEQK